MEKTRNEFSTETFLGMEYVPKVDFVDRNIPYELIEKIKQASDEDLGRLLEETLKVAKDNYVIKKMFGEKYMEAVIVFLEQDLLKDEVDNRKILVKPEDISDQHIERVVKMFFPMIGNKDLDKKYDLLESIYTVSVKKGRNDLEKIAEIYENTDTEFITKLGENINEDALLEGIKNEKTKYLSMTLLFVKIFYQIKISNIDEFKSCLLKEYPLLLDESPLDNENKRIKNKKMLTRLTGILVMLRGNESPANHLEEMIKLTKDNDQDVSGLAKRTLSRVTIYYNHLNPQSVD